MSPRRPLAGPVPATVHRHLRPAALSVALLVAGAAQADTLVLANGDRLTGTLVSADAHRIVFRSDLLGQVEVAAGQARVEPTPPAIASASPAPTAADGAAAPADPAKPVWQGDLGAKLAVDRGSLKTRENDLDAALTLVRRTDVGELHAKLAYDYKRSDDLLKDDDWAASVSYDKFLGARNFTAGRFLATTDLTTEGYDRTVSLSAAYGWRLWERDDRYLRVGPAAGYLAITRGDERFDGPALGFYLRAKGPVWGRTTFTSELQMLDSLGDGRYANLELRLRQPLGERLYLGVLWNYVWSDFDIESGIRSEWRWEIGWRFGQTEPK